MSEPTTMPARSVRKRQTILSAGRELFLANGYQGTSMDQVAATASVSKQTVYKHFGDKHELLLAIVDDALHSTVSAFSDRIAALADTTDLDADLTALAADYLRTVLAEPVVQLRRLVVGEANRVPDLAARYYTQAPAHTLAAFAECFGRLHERGLLYAPEPGLAAEHFAFLTIGRVVDQALFHGGPAVLAAIDPQRHGEEAVRVFLAAYGVNR